MIGSPQGWLVLGGVVTVLSMASLAAALMGRRIPAGSASRPTVDNLIARIRSWWFIVVVLASAILAGQRAVIILFALVSFGALREFITLTPTRRPDHGAVFLSFFVVIPIQYSLVWTEWYGVFSIFIPVYVFLILPAFTVLWTGTTANFLARTAEMQWGLLVCVYCISHIPGLLMLKIPRQDPAMLIVFLIIVVQASDVLQYIWGKSLGKRRVAPEVSPSKTLAGLIGGIFSATLIGAALCALTPFSGWQAAAFSFVLCSMGFIGGLVMSAIKRDRGVKDWGRLLEGHGGMLDRLDSLCFAAPIFFHLTRYFFSRT